MIRIDWIGLFASQRDESVNFMHIPLEKRMDSRDVPGEEMTARWCIGTSIVVTSRNIIYYSNAASE